MAGLCKAPRAYRYDAIKILIIIVILILLIIINHSACLFVLGSPTVTNCSISFELTKTRKAPQCQCTVATLNTIFKFVFLLQCNSLKWNVSLQLFIKRMKVASGSEKQALLQLDPSFMSDEEDGDEGEARSWIVRSPSWRSPELTSLVKRLQGKVEAQSGSSHPKNKRLHGEPSTRPPPPSSPAWALGTLDRDNHPRSPSPQPLSPFPDAPHSLQRPRAAFSSEEDEDSESGDEYRVLDHVDSPVNRRRNKRVRPLND